MFGNKSFNLVPILCVSQAEAVREKIGYADSILNDTALNEENADVSSKQSIIISGLSLFVCLSVCSLFTPKPLGLLTPNLAWT